MYDDENRATEVDLTDVDKVEELVRETAKTICAEQPDMPEPESMSEMDSFSVVQMLLEIENVSGRKLLEKFEDYSYGEEFRDLAEHIVAIVVWENANPDWDPTSDEPYTGPKGSSTDEADTEATDAEAAGSSDNEADGSADGAGTTAARATNGNGTAHNGVKPVKAEEESAAPGTSA